MSETTLVLPDETPEMPEGAAPLAAVEPDLGEQAPQTRAFDSTPYRLDIPEVDGVDAEKIIIAFAGSVELDISNEGDLALFNGLRLGREIDMRVAGVVADKPSPLKVAKDGSQTMIRKAKISVHTVHVLAPEDL